MMNMFSECVYKGKRVRLATTRDGLRQATQKRVIAATDRLFSERGFDATTIRDIAGASDVSVGTVMAVGDKNALLVQVFDALIEEWHVLRGEPVAEVTGACSEQIVGLVKPFVILFTSRQDLARVYASILVSGNSPSTLFTRLASLLVDEIRSVITRHGCVQHEAAGATAEAIYFAYIGTLFSWSAREVADEAELSESLRATFAAICNCEE